MKVKLKYKTAIVLEGKDMQEIGDKWKALGYTDAEVAELIILEP